MIDRGKKGRKGKSGYCPGGHDDDGMLVSRSFGVDGFDGEDDDKMVEMMTTMMMMVMVMMMMTDNNNNDS